MKKIILPVTLLCAMGIHAMEIRDIELADTPTLCLAHATDPHNGGISAPVFSLPRHHRLDVALSSCAGEQRMHVPILINSAREQTVEITYLEHVLTFSVLPVDTDLFVGELVMHDTNDRKLLEDRAYQAIAPGDAHHLDCPELDTCLKFSVPAGEPQVLLTGERGVHPTVEINLARIAQAIGNGAHSAEFRLLADDEEGRRVADAVGPLLTEYEQLLDKRHERKRHLDDEEDEVARKRRGDYLDYIARRITHTLLEACPASETASDSSRNSDMSD